MTPQVFQSAIHSIRGESVVLDSDLAALYGVTTTVFNQAIKRNASRFPEDFSFVLTQPEFSTLMSQIVTSKGRGGRRKLPRVFTEHGAIMAATVLNSEQAAAMSVYVVRAFVKMRRELLADAALETRLAKIDQTLLSHDAALRDLYSKLRPLLMPSPPAPPKSRIGFTPTERKP